MSSQPYSALARKRLQARARGVIPKPIPQAPSPGIVQPPLARDGIPLARDGSVTRGPSIAPRWNPRNKF